VENEFVAFCRSVNNDRGGNVTWLEYCGVTVIWSIFYILFLHTMVVHPWMKRGH